MRGASTYPDSSNHSVIFYGLTYLTPVTSEWGYLGFTAEAPSVFLAWRQLPPWHSTWQHSYSAWQSAKQIWLPLQVDWQKLRFWTHTLPQLTATTVVPSVGLAEAAFVLKNIDRTSNMVTLTRAEIRRGILKYFLSGFEISVLRGAHL